MVVRALLYDGDDEIGSIIAFRLDPLTEPNPDDRCRYSWTLQVKGDPERTGLVEHRHGDGPWTLIARIADKAGL